MYLEYKLKWTIDNTIHTRSAKLITARIGTPRSKDMLFDLRLTQVLGTKMDKPFALLMSSSFFILLCYTHSDSWTVLLSIIVIIGSLFAHSTNAIYRSNRSGIAKVSRSMTGLILMSMSGIRFSKQIFRWSLGLQILITIAFSILIYKTQRVFVSHIRLPQLILAAVLDLIIVFFILNR